MATRLLRVTAILALLAGMIWVGEGLGPRRAEAEVYRVLEFQTSSLLRFLDREIRPGGERLIVLNGNLLRCRLGSTRLRPAQLLDRLQALPSQGLAPPAGTDELDPAQIDAEVARLLRRPFRLEGRGWGAFGRIVGGSPDDVTPLLPHLAETGTFGPAGVGGYLVLALGGRHGALTDVWLIRFDEDFDWLSLLREEAGDVPGGDVPGLPRFADSRRVLTLSEFSDVGESHAVGYEGGGSTRNHVHHYERALAKLGLRPIHPTSIVADQALIRFGSEDRDVTVFVSKTEQGRTLDLVQVNTSGENG
jgi:hypothetical protein